MNPTRRTFLSALAALPLVGWIVPKVKAAPPAIKTVEGFETEYAVVLASATGAWTYNNCRWHKRYSDGSVEAWQSMEKDIGPSQYPA